MNEIIFNYIVQAILGGASGYITNDYAINMLFKEYTPLKIGGVIKKTRHEFVDNLSSMIENDIISKDKLQDILCDESLKKEFENMTADFYKNSLYEAVGSETFAHIDGFEKTVNSADIFAAEIVNEHMPELYNLIIKNINVNDFLSSKQSDIISNSLYSIAVEVIDNTDIVDNMLLSVFKNNDKLVLNNVVDNSSCNIVVKNAVDILTQLISESDNEKIEELLNSFNLNKAINSAVEILSSKKVKDVINLDNNTINIINTNLLNYINSEKGDYFINSLMESLFSYGKECNKSIFELLDSSFEENLKLYLIKNIPSVTESVVDWIKLNSNMIDKLIEESIDEVIKESDGLKAKLLSLIKNAYFNSLSKKYSIVDKIIAYVKKVAEPEKLSQNLSNKIIEILNKVTVREIILEAESNHITTENIKKFIVNYINKNFESIINKTAGYVSEVEIKKLLPAIELNDEFKASVINKIKSFTSSETAKKYAVGKTSEYIANILSKELKDLVDDDTANDYVSKLKGFISNKVKSNENSINEWIHNQLAILSETYSTLTLSHNLTSQLNDAIYKNYNSASAELKDVNLSSALDKLNSIDNLAKNSSESLRSFAVKNADAILNGSIKAIVSDNLNKLDDDELVDLANDFIGRELKPIMFFGGVLGVVAGLILATFQNKAINPSEINIANMFVYALVGYITNVVAINMIFKPYREIKLFSKIPFLRNFSLGYIVKNKKTFAKNTAHFIDSNLLSKKSINELFDKYKDKIKASFTETIAYNDYKTLSSLLDNNKQSVTRSIYSFLKTKLYEKSSNIGAFLYDKISRIKASSLINDNAINKASSLLTVKILDSRITSDIYSFINSDSALESKLSGDFIKNYLNENEENLYNKLSIMLSEKESLNFILKNTDKYQNYINKTINELIPSEKKDELVSTISEKASNFVLSKDSRDKITRKVVDLINKSIDRNKNFEEILDGKLKKYIDSQIPGLLEKMTIAVTKNIRDSKSKVSLMVQSEIKNNLGFIEKSMYSLMGGDEIVDELLTKIIMEKIPKFLDDKKLELNSIANFLLQEKLYKAKVEVLYTGLNKLQLNEVLDNYFSSDNSLKIKNKVYTATKDMLSKTENVKISSILKLFYADDINGLLNMYNKELSAFTNEIRLNLESSRLNIMESMSAYINFLTNGFMKSKFKDLFAGISEENIKYIETKIIDELNKNNIENSINLFLSNCKNHIDVNLGELIDRDEFIKAAEKNIIFFTESPIVEKEMKRHIEAIIDDAVSVNFNFIDSETKQYLLNIFIDSSINSLKRNLNEVLKSIEFDEIAMEEIDRMEPEKIHEMFDSFAGKYFKRLMLYGFGGFVFGINMFVGFSLTALKIISELFAKKD